MNEPVMNDSLWVTGYSPDGFKVSLTLLLTAERDVQFQLAYVRSQGIVPREPGVEPGTERELITTVMRRAKGDGTPIIDFYPNWKPGGDEPFGTYKYVHKYLNTPDDVAAVLAICGFMDIEQIPLYDGQAPLKRTAGKRHPKETAVPTPFYVVRKQGEEKIGSDGKTYRPWEIVRYEPALAAEKSTAQDTGKTTSRQPTYDRAAVLELITPLYDHSKDAAASLDKLLNHTDSDQEHWWIQPSYLTIKAAYTVLLYKAYSTDGVGLDTEQVLAALEVGKLSEWANQFEDEGEGLQAAWRKLQAANTEF